ncbi:hypothetical protein TCAL_11567 [Tigriopus californicus]|uniref:Phosphoribulokinase/uridine kinase domain-containing protein n=2 Tax=Tigriopus californicus TaxID=6832 RepID=A0A553NBP7_TIGCA|nr:hypothetical protein TCAL_11567 [Tigriopus californicus]|eukprot:TCALIF_11567-PA protein Name:"Similar to Nmrk1 Nicotinamide riboside kinase 1 (Mus musculus)" AED:0.43 eAED:0.43 QI:0/-1/0/1/-1/1/1/0/211
MTSSCLIIGISGATCAGKSTLAQALAAIFPQVRHINQDDYYYPEDHPRHQWVSALNHINWELPSACDMDQLYDDMIRGQTHRTVNQANSNIIPLTPEQLKVVADFRTLGHNLPSPVLILEGITLFNHEPVRDACDWRFFLTLDYDECRKRRNQRAYDPPDVPKYFDTVVWPQYQSNESLLRSSMAHQIDFLDGSQEFRALLDAILKRIVHP